MTPITSSLIIDTFKWNQANVLLTRFADDKNSKLPRFNSKFLCPRSEAVNVFSCDWHGEINWLCPPIYSIGDTLKHAAHC